jgi:hypothetical protein
MRLLVGGLQEFDPRRQQPLIFLPPAYFFCSIVVPQHLSVPAPALVTITCEPHLPQM